MGEDSGTQKFKKEDLLKVTEKKDSIQENFSEDHIEKIADLFSNDAPDEDTGSFEPLKEEE